MEFKDEILCKILDHHRYFSDNLIGQISISLEEFIVKKQVFYF